MVALASLPYPFATFVSYKAYRIPQKTLIRSSVRVPSSSLRRTKRKNYLRPKILKTLTKPYNTPLEEPVDVPKQTVVPNFEAPLKSTVEQSGSSFVEELENESGLSQVEVVRNLEAQNLLGFDGISGLTVVKIVGSFVGLFILQTVISVVFALILGFGDSDETDGNVVTGDRKKDLRWRMREGKVGNNGNVFLKNLAGVDESEMEAKISEIRKMAWEVREAEKMKKVKNDEADSDDASDDDNDNEDFESDDSRINTGILKEVDLRLSKLKKKYPAPSLNVDLLNKFGSSGKERKDEVLEGKKEDNMLRLKTKRKFRSHLATSEEKPKGFHSVDGIRENHSNMDDENPVGKTESGTQITNVLESTIPEKRINGVDKEDKIPASQTSAPSKGFRKGFGSNGTKKLDKGINDSTASGSNAAGKKESKGKNEGAKPEIGLNDSGSNWTVKNSMKKNEDPIQERGLVQNLSDGNILDEGTAAKMSSSISTPGKRKMNVASVTSKTSTLPQRKGQPNSNKLESKLPRSIDKDELESADPWWLKIPYVLVVLMQNGIGSDAQRGFYNIRIYTDVENQSYVSYTVGFEDQTDARNFSYLLESAFEDLPDAAVDVAPLSTKDFKEVTETLDSKVIVLRKGELKLYAGQPLADAEAALRSLVK